MRTGSTLNRPIEQLMNAVGTRIQASKADIQADIALLKKQRVRTAGDLYQLYSRKDVWRDLDLPLLVKKELEVVLLDLRDQGPSPGSSGRDTAPLLERIQGWIAY